MLKRTMLVLCLAAGGCATTGTTPQTPEEVVAHAAFQRDRAACLSVAERSWPYVNVKDARGVARRQTEVEADAQRCMLARGWNDPKFDGWSAGRSWGLVEMTAVSSRDVRPARNDEIEPLMRIWRAASRKGHPFLSEEDLDAQEALTREVYLPQADLWVAPDADDRPLGFIALLGDHVGALFVSPDRSSSGVGRALVEHAACSRPQLTVAVYEANEAVGFYERLGFRTVDRSETDDQGRALPLLTMKRVVESAWCIGPAADGDHDALWSVLEPVLRSGETYALPSDWSKDDALGWLFSGGRAVYVAGDGQGVGGFYYLAPNQLGGGAHVANAGFVVGRVGAGVGSALCADALHRARRSGYRAMQFNSVVSTNTRAVALWNRFGFREVGRIPEGFDHPTHGLVDLLVMHRKL